MTKSVVDAVTTRKNAYVCGGVYGGPRSPDASTTYRWPRLTVTIGPPLLASGGQMNDSVPVGDDTSVNPEDTPCAPVSVPLTHASLTMRHVDT